MDIFKYISPIFKDSKILEKGGIIFGLYLISGVVSYVINVGMQMTGFLPESLYDNPSFSLAVMATNLFLPLLSMLITFPISLYLSGYQYMIADGIRTGSEDILPEHTDIGDTIKLGGIKLTLSLAVLMPIFIVSTLAILLTSIAVPGLFAANNPALGLGIGAGLIVIIILFGLVLLFVNSILVPSFMYLYLRDRSMASAFSLSNVSDVVSRVWLQLLLLTGVLVLLSIGTGIVQLVFCCAGPLLNPFLQAVTLLATAAMTGSIYRYLHEGDMAHTVTSGVTSANRYDASFQGSNSDLRSNPDPIQGQHTPEQSQTSGTEPPQTPVQPSQSPVQSPKDPYDTSGSNSAG